MIEQAPKGKGKKEKKPKEVIKSAEAQAKALPEKEQGDAYSNETKRPYSKKEVAKMNAAYKAHEVVVEDTEILGTPKEQAESRIAQSEKNRDKILDKQDVAARERAGMLPEGYDQMSDREKKIEQSKLGILGKTDEGITKQQAAQLRANESYSRKEIEVGEKKEAAAKAEKEVYRPRLNQHMDEIQTGIDKKDTLGDIQAVYRDQDAKLTMDTMEHQEYIKPTSADKKVITSLASAVQAEGAYNKLKQKHDQRGALEKVAKLSDHLNGTMFKEGAQYRGKKRELKRSLAYQRIERSDNPPIIKKLMRGSIKTKEGLRNMGGPIMTGGGLIALSIAFLISIPANWLLNAGASYAKKLLKPAPFLSDIFYKKKDKAKIRGGGGDKKK